MGGERVWLFLQDVGDHTDGPDVTRHVVLLRTQHFRSCKQQTSNNKQQRDNNTHPPPAPAQVSLPLPASLPSPHPLPCLHLATTPLSLIPHSNYRHEEESHSEKICLPLSFIYPRTAEGCEVLQSKLTSVTTICFVLESPYLPWLQFRLIFTA